MKVLFLISIMALLVTSCASRREREAQNTPPPAIPAATNATTVVHLTDANFDKETRSQKVVLLLFWAPWSAPDREIIPVIDAISRDYSGKVKTGKVNIDENPELARKFKIEGIPTVVVLKDGSEKERVVGVQSKKKISDLLDKQLQ